LLIVALWEVPELEIRERPPSTLRNVNDGPLGVAGARDPGAPTINAKKRQHRPPWEVSKLEIQECPPSMLRNVDDGPLGGDRAGDLTTPIINAKKC
jgi:hypothetical protein